MRSNPLPIVPLNVLGKALELPVWLLTRPTTGGDTVQYIHTIAPKNGFAREEAASLPMIGNRLRCWYVLRIIS